MERARGEQQNISHGQKDEFEKLRRTTTVLSSGLNGDQQDVFDAVTND